MRLPWRRGERGSSLDLLVVGLGNPGREYAGNRHNVGFMVADELARRHGATWRTKFSGRLADVRIDEHRVGLLKPETYMNESGRSVQAAAAFYKLEPDAVLVVHDESDLELGRLQARLGGGLAGHNGLRSVSQSPRHLRLPAPARRRRPARSRRPPFARRLRARGLRAARAARRPRRARGARRRDARRRRPRGDAARLQLNRRRNPASSGGRDPEDPRTAGGPSYNRLGNANHPMEGRRARSRLLNWEHQRARRAPRTGRTPKGCSLDLTHAFHPARARFRLPRRLARLPQVGAAGRPRHRRPPRGRRPVRRQRPLHPGAPYGRGRAGHQTERLLVPPAPRRRAALDQAEARRSGGSGRSSSGPVWIAWRTGRAAPSPRGASAGRSTRLP